LKGRCRPTGCLAHVRRRLFVKSRQDLGRSAPATERSFAGALSRRELIGTSLLAAGLAATASEPLSAQNGNACQQDGQPGRRIIDSHIHLWKLPRNAPPMNDFATFPTGCCGSVPWMEVDRLVPDYNARVGGPKVEKLVLIESSVGVPPIESFNRTFGCFRQR